MCEEGMVLAAAVCSCGELLELSPVPPSVVICETPAHNSHPDQVPVTKPHESQLQFHCHRCCKMIGTSFNSSGARFYPE